MNNNNSNFNNYNNNNNYNKNYGFNNQNNNYNNNNFNNSNMNNMNQSSINNIILENDIDISKININGDDNFDLPEMPKIDNSRIKESKENKDKKMIENIIKVCDNKFKNAVAQFKNYQIVESKKNMKYVISSLNTLEQNVKNQKQFAMSLLPNIESLKKDISNKLNEYNYFTYILAQNVLKNIQYQRNLDLPTFAEKFVIKRPYVSFDDIFDTALDPNKPTKNILLNIFNDAQFSGYKSLFLYGPKGSGKTLYVHALANELGAILGQIDSLQIIKIDYFVKEFARVITEYSTRPIIIYLKNVDNMARDALSEILFLHDKFNTEQRKVLFICSSPYPMRGLPFQLKFKYVQLINCAGQKNKYQLFKFLFEKFGINFKMSDEDLSVFTAQNFRNYSNRDVFYVIKSMMDIKKQNGEDIYDLGRNEMEKAMKMRPGTIDPQSMQFYYL
jgi:SpoVK/Ycf46/Vps4 family AAA+-type ATPase